MTEQHTTVSTVADGVARIEWVPELHDAGLSAAVDVVRREVDAALTAHPRVEALVAPDDELAQRVATWSGLRREGVMRGVTVDGEPVDRIVYARLATDAPAHEPDGFRALLNSFLPRKRAISQMLIRDDAERVLLCQLTYKQDWDLPGGVPSSRSPARSRRSWAWRSRPARCCSPTGSRRGVAGTTPCAWCSTAAATVPRSWTGSSSRPGRSGPRSSARSSRSRSVARTSPHGGSGPRSSGSTRVAAGRPRTPSPGSDRRI